MNNKFVSDFNTPKKEKPYFFYQIALYKDPDYKMYHVRQFTLNTKNEIIKIRNFYLSEEQLKEFKNINKNLKIYKLYSSFNLKEINYPKMSDILLSKSTLLNQKSLKDNTLENSKYAKY